MQRVRPRHVIAVGAALAVLLGGCSREGADDPLTRALTAHAEGDVEEAAGLYEDILEDDPNNKFAHYNLGLIAQSQGRTDEAIAAYERAIKIDPKFVAPLFNLAVIHTESRPDEAIELYRRVIASEPDHAGAHLNLGFLLKDTGKNDEGEAELDKAVELDPSLEARRSAPADDEP
jgi:tetratricopeptide (TPR) repeat protein